MGIVLRRVRVSRFGFLAFFRRYFGFLAAAVVAMIAAAAMLPGLWHDAGASRMVQGVTAIDGDSLRVNGERIRLAGIDAPELSQTCREAQGSEWSCGQAAKARLVELVARGNVACSERGRDRHGRTLAVCSVGGIADLGGALVREGYAVAYTRYSYAYLPAQLAARAAGRGLWRGSFESPEDWRRRRPRSARRTD